MIKNIQIKYYEPRNLECGAVHIWVDHFVKDTGSLDKLNETMNKIAQDLFNLISATDFNKAPINEGEWEQLHYTIYLGRSDIFEIQRMSWTEKLEKAKEIVSKYIY